MLAPAKINLDLLITGRRDDGYHLLDSIVVFTELGDHLTAEISDKLSLNISGPFADGLKADENNLIIKAANLICDNAGISPNIKFNLVKNLPISSGIGGGSADAAAALKLCMELLAININEKILNHIALKLGADVPVCLISETSHMQGIGEKITKINFKTPLHILLVNPMISVSTPNIFNQYAKLSTGFDQNRLLTTKEIHLPLMLDILKVSGNSLSEAALNVEPEIYKVLQALSETQGILLTRLSGSGATCFALYDNKENCLNAANKLKIDRPNWWICNTKT
ncbi:MAG: 4-(cytidine 5'-diphospho)-2-C-methyl-D-erythritol kinase [Kordiimonadaceae bacterium]|nr:4-(cytidine 5'-diphospho)-2-C-methyl-D-erythritol kinase [Kordiimonadaceae bacterium]